MGRASVPRPRSSRGPSGCWPDCADPPDECVQRGATLNLALPDDEHPPAELVQGALVAAVARAVAPQLDRPPGPVRPWDGRSATSDVPVPEAAVDEDDGSEARQDDVRSAGKGHRMKPEAQAGCVQGSPDGQFRLGIPRPDRGHDP